MKVKTWFIFTIAVFALQTLAIFKLYKDNARLADNFGAIVKGTEYYHINDSISAARSERILLDNAEIKAYFPEITKTIGQMDVKLRQLERSSAVTSTANYDIASRLRDTTKVIQTIYNDRIIRDTVKLQYIRYKDKWIDFQQAIVADSAYTAIQTRDSISIAQSWERIHQWWFLKWGRKRHVQNVTNANPHAKITYSIFIEKK